VASGERNRSRCGDQPDGRGFRRGYAANFRCNLGPCERNGREIRHAQCELTQHTTEAYMKVGFIGLGRMGSAMAANLVKAGHEVTVFNRSPQKRRPLAALGAREAATIAEASQGEVVITMLADDAAVSSTVFSEGGVLESLREGAVHVSMSTISVSLSDQLAAAHEGANQYFVAAPVFGRPEAAEAARLFIVVAGELEARQACQPLFEAIGQKTFPVGSEPRAANLVKLSGNFLIAAVMESLGEALALVGKAGIDRGLYVDLLSATIFPAPIYRTYGDLIASNQFEPAGFLAPLGYKDIRFTLAAADSLRVPMPLAGLLRDRFLRVLARGGESLDWSAIGGLASEDAQSPVEIGS
jgi:3-hydroxyisobutyrate dehydrogenase-like beta-hydroxyacid dehydrogenase